MRSLRYGYYTSWYCAFVTSRTRSDPFPVLKNGAFLAQEIESLLTNYLTSGLPTPSNSPASWELMCDYHFGGYAKINDELLVFSQQFREEHGIPLDYVYSAKMFYGVIDLLKQGFLVKAIRCCWYTQEAYRATLVWKKSCRDFLKYKLPLN